MSFSFRDYQANSVSGAGDTITVTVNTQSGDLVVFGVKWETSNTAITSITDTIGNSYVQDTRIDNPGVNAEPHGQMFHVLSSIGSNSSNVITFKFTSAAVTFKQIRVWTWSHTNPAALDVEVPGAAQTTPITTDPISGTFTTTVANTLVLAFCAGYTGSANWLTPTVGGNAATGRGDDTLIDTYGWDYLASSIISSGTVAVDKTDTQRWSITGLAFKETAKTIVSDPGFYSVTGIPTVLRPGSTTYLRYRK